MTDLQRRNWTRFAIGLAIVGAVLTAGQWVPPPGIDRHGMVSVIQSCAGGSGSILWPFPIIICPGPQLLHQEMGGQAVLGTVALLTFIVLWVRRRVARRRSAR